MPGPTMLANGLLTERENAFAIALFLSLTIGVPRWQAVSHWNSLHAPSQNPGAQFNHSAH